MRRFLTPRSFSIKNPLSPTAATQVRGSSNDVRGSEVSGSQTSLRSSDSGASHFDIKNTNVRRRTLRSSGRSSRPCSMPVGPEQLDKEFLKSSTMEPPQSVPTRKGDYKSPGGSSTLPATLPPQMQHHQQQQQQQPLLNSGVVVTISSCSKCSKCNCLIYDEEIMAGWTDEESNLNTHCFVCNFLFVPFLNIEIKDYRGKREKANTSSPSKNSNEKSRKNSCKSDPLQQPSCANGIHSNTAAAPRKTIELAFPYLSPIVLRKEIESLLENDGSRVFASPSFVDEHPIIYWNLVWYFRRIDVYSNLYNLVLKSLMLKMEPSEVPAAAPTPTEISLGTSSSSLNGGVVVNLMWDNLKLQQDRSRDPIYCVWTQIVNDKGKATTRRQYPISLIHNIKDSITQEDDVRSPLVALLTQFHVHRKELRRSAYREILFFIIVALGKGCIDLDAFDREYKRAYDALTMSELDMFKREDRLPSQHACACRRQFSSLDLYK